MPREKIEFIYYKPQGFIKSLHKGAYTRYFLKPVDDNVYVIKDALDKNDFLYNDLAIYYEHEIILFKDMLDPDKSDIPKEIAYEYIRKSHYLVKMFGGVVSKNRCVDPDPTMGDTPDLRLWKNLNNYGFIVTKDDGFDQVIKTLRMKRFRLVFNNEGELGVFAPKYMEAEEKSMITARYIKPYKEILKAALKAVGDLENLK